MRALRGTLTDSPQLQELETPTPGPGQILIRRAAAAISPSDAMVASGAARARFDLADETGIGWDLSGTVEALGEGVTGFREGDGVAALVAPVALPIRGQADFVAVPAEDAALVPEGISLLEAGTVPLNTLTADQALALTAAELDGEIAGKRLLITGAAGGVGGYAIDLAVEAGWQVDGLARPGDREFVEAAGARHVTEIEEGAYAAVFDTANIPDAALASLEKGGVFTGIRGPWRQDLPMDFRYVFHLVEPDGERLAELLQRSLSPTFAPRIDSVYPLEDFKAAYERFGQSGLRGRVVLAG
ncbi:NADP-dependent oxidoreductase [Arthrobacter sp. UM1]|uniref:NADP-dependent oxidoreductase n=1 Tax=Arthrobacter sp. UM1 TaxID=2766776 RepID=UPI001CF6A9B0|nr:NADP-dependent oxidoreductase [Arthrobacter sp. UM1]MCB4207864.1 NADP-dependent oxidoreductase [Arthrobacter sp. UM1]